jgi:hypothetical protein
VKWGSGNTSGGDRIAQDAVDHEKRTHGASGLGLALQAQTAEVSPSHRRARHQAQEGQISQVTRMNFGTVYPSSDARLSPGQQIYADLMDEARIRIHAMRDAINARDSWTPRLLQEFLYLQLRTLCETIALGCLVAHGDVKNRSTLKRWDIPAVVKEMENLNPDFYPRPVRIRFSPGVVKLDDYTAPALSKAELLTLWERSGSFVHRGSAKDLLAKQGSELVVNLDPVIQWGAKILNLLEQHVISSADKKSHIVALLSHVESEGRSAVWIAKSP